MRKLKLNQKLTLAFFCLVLIPVILLAVELFRNMQAMLIEDKIKDMETSLLKVRFDVEKAVELCNLTTQYFLNNPSLSEFLIKVKDGQELTVDELISFYREDVGNLEKQINANPYLYQVRIYQPNEAVPEIMPILYHQSRMERLEWGDSWSSGNWQFDYDDVIFSTVAMNPVPHIMSLTTAIESHPEGELGILEVSVRMDDVFPQLYDGESVCALVIDGVYYAGESSSAFWQDHGGEIGRILEKDGLVHTTDTLLGGERVLVSAIPLESFDGVYLKATPVSDIAGGLEARRNIYLTVTVFSLLLMAMVVNYLIKRLLRGFYGIVKSAAQLREGNMSITVPDTEDDEIGILAHQINHLMQENMDRQLLAKNAEIKALHSQINAHFIYNVLESIKMMAEVDGQYEISDAITSLGKLLRYSMHWTSSNMTVADEVGYIRDYLALINLRFDHQISLDCDIPDPILVQEVPKMVLQPIVENVVIHGAREMAEDIRIDITAQRQGEDAFLLQITDNGQGIPPQQLEQLRERINGQVLARSDLSAGIGLKNVHDRIKMACGEQYGLTVESRAKEFTRINILFPMKEVALDSYEYSAGR